MIDILVVAAGSGKRMGAKQNKLYLELGPHPILYHCLKNLSFSPLISRIFPIIKSGEESEFSEMLNQNGPVEKLQQPILGGKERFDSTINGLTAILEHDPADMVMVHDAARPLVSIKIIEDLAQAVKKGLCAVPALPVADTTRSLIDGSITLVDRSQLYSIQTPQAFLTNEIEEVFFTDAAKAAEPTDEAGYFELSGKQVAFVEGSKANLKITTPEDLIVASAFLESQT